LVDPVDVFGQLVEQPQPQAGVGLAGLAGFVAEVVGEPGEAVQGGQVPPVAFAPDALAATSSARVTPGRTCSRTPVRSVPLLPPVTSPFSRECTINCKQ
jgi:hypothetical protein